jgi:curved DNA-binding protein CbpA
MPADQRSDTDRDEPDPYKVLQVDSEADPDVIQAAYRRLAQKYHPDTRGDAESSKRMAAINAAWAILRDPQSRAELDRARADRATRDALRAVGPRASPVDGPLADAGPTRAEPAPTSSDWSSGRSSVGSRYDAATMRRADGYGAAGPPPSQPSGTILPFGRFAGWSLSQVAAKDIDYVEWLDRMPIGRPYREEIDTLLRRAGRRRAGALDAPGRRGLFRGR